MAAVTPLCEEPGCRERAIACRPVDAQGAQAYYCRAHAPQHGYCYDCGTYAGSALYQGLCPLCRAI